MAATAALVALHHRNRTGEGQLIDFAQSEGLIRALDWTWVRLGLTGRDRGPAGNRDEALVPAEIFPCRNGYVAIAAARDSEFRGLCEAMGNGGLAGDARFATLQARQKPENTTALLERIRAWAGKLARAEVEAAGARHGFAAARVATAKDKHDDDHLRARGAVWEYEDPLYGTMVEQGPAPKLSQTPARIKWAAKPVGWHNQDVFMRLLGLSPSQLKELSERKVIGQWADRPGAKPPAEWDGSAQV
jgi:crotonobetainyl-CoA:carnitine CoA-transferase CaiB-like acyl-CoA transferase